MVFGNEQTKAFEALKKSLSREPVLACFRLEAPTFVVTDASPVGLGLILLQDQGTGQRKPVAYISRSLTPTERRYSQIEREALGCVWAVERLHNYLFGVNFTLLTDNKPLSSMFDPHSRKKESSASHGVCTNITFELRTSRKILTQQTCCHVCHQKTMISQTVALFVKIMYDLCTRQTCPVCKLSLFLT